MNVVKVAELVEACLPITQARSARKHMHATLIVMAEETDAGTRKSPCVLLEGNHRCV